MKMAEQHKIRNATTQQAGRAPLILGALSLQII